MVTFFSIFSGVFLFLFFVVFLYKIWNDFSRKKLEEKPCKMVGKVSDFPGKLKTLSHRGADLPPIAVIRSNNVGMTRHLR